MNTESQETLIKVLPSNCCLCSCHCCQQSLQVIPYTSTSQRRVSSFTTRTHQTGGRKKEFPSPIPATAYDSYSEQHLGKTERQASPSPPPQQGSPYSSPGQLIHRITMLEPAGNLSQRVCRDLLLSLALLRRELISCALIVLLCSTLHLDLLPAAAR